MKSTCDQHHPDGQIHHLSTTGNKLREIPCLLIALQRNNVHTEKIILKSVKYSQNHHFPTLASSQIKNDYDFRNDFVLLLIKFTF